MNSVRENSTETADIFLEQDAEGDRMPDFLFAQKSMTLEHVGAQPTARRRAVQNAGEFVRMVPLLRTYVSYWNLESKGDGVSVWPSGDGGSVGVSWRSRALFCSGNRLLPRNRASLWEISDLSCKPTRWSLSRSYGVIDLFCWRDSTPVPT